MCKLRGDRLRVGRDPLARKKSTAQKYKPFADGRLITHISKFRFSGEWDGLNSHLHYIIAKLFNGTCRRMISCSDMRSFAVICGHLRLSCGELRCVQPTY